VQAPEAQGAIENLLREGRTAEAFERLLDARQEKVFRLMYSMTRDQVLAEDLTQEAFVKAWKALPAWRGESSLSTWLYTIARRTALDEIAARRSKGALSLDEPAVLAAAEGAHAVSTEPGAAHDAERMLARLPRHYREALTLFYLEEKSYEETALAMGVPMGTLKTYLHRARKELAGAFTEGSAQARSSRIKETAHVLL
jgi:RNA polymerase sigma-70 factor (ECF subfamily)